MSATDCDGVKVKLRDVLCRYFVCSSALVKRPTHTGGVFHVRVYQRSSGNEKAGGVMETTEEKLEPTINIKQNTTSPQPGFSVKIGDKTTADCK